MIKPLPADLVALSRGVCPGKRPDPRRVVRDVLGHPVGYWTGEIIIADYSDVIKDKKT